jgi:hypothetical protein
MEQTPLPPIKKKSKHLGLIFGGLIVVGIIIAAASSNSNPSTSTQSGTSVSPAAQTAIQAQQLPIQQDNTLSNNNSYVNSSGNTVHSPAYSKTVPVGATAQCRDGTYSFSQHRQGTCSHHGGITKWL